MQKKGDIAYLYVRVCVYDKRCRLFLIFLIRLLLFIKGLNCVFYFSHCCNGLFILSLVGSLISSCGLFSVGLDTAFTILWMDDTKF